ncbi:glycerophosphodiester phosphodiesterase [bacterium]|nr:glycerophosphodiester phosphodiesterase [bacterium]RQV95736.1 MAG: glycerophosphodiester phosphodiesterase [bacterium]
MLLCIGHRGARGYAPENTLKSIAKAIELGTPWIEIDVHLVDNHLVVIHDNQLKRTTNGIGKVSNKTFNYLRSLDAGEGEKIPTLNEVLDLIDRRAGLNIELKGTNTAEAVVNLIQERCSMGWNVQQFLVSAFKRHEIVKTKQLDDRIRTGALICGFPFFNAKFAQKLGAYSVHQCLRFINRKLVKDAHRRGLKVYVYTVNRPEDVEKMADMGVDGLFSDYPDRVMHHKRFNKISH